MALFNVANAAGALVRAGMNSIFGKLHGNYIGATDPAVAGDSAPGMLWVDTSGAKPTLKMRNSSDTAWVSLGALSGADAFELEGTTAFSRSLLDDADAAAARATLGVGTAATLNTSSDDAFASADPAQLAVRQEVFDQHHLRYGIGNGNGWITKTTDHVVLDGTEQTPAMFPWNTLVEFPRRFTMHLRVYYPGSLDTDRQLLMQPLDATETLISPAFITEKGAGSNYEYFSQDGILLNTVGSPTDGQWQGRLDFTVMPSLSADWNNSGVFDNPSLPNMSGECRGSFWNGNYNTTQYFSMIGTARLGVVAGKMISGYLFKPLGSSTADINQVEVQYSYRKCDLVRYNFTET